jgi:hypothetical protein
MRIINKRKEHLVILAMPDGDEIGVYYRSPETKELHGYNNEAIQRKRNQVTFRHSQAQLKYGKLIITGLREGDFGFEDDGGRAAPVSTHPDSPNYRKDWLELLEKNDPVVIIGLGAHVFGGTEAMGPDEETGEDVGQD